jgi:PIN domain nuclease of toxin-antitoxin system
MRDAIRDPGNDAYLSVVSLWEVITKYKLGKLLLPHPPKTYLPAQRKMHVIAMSCRWMSQALPNWPVFPRSIVIPLTEC